MSTRKKPEELRRDVLRTAERSRAPEGFDLDRTISEADKQITDKVGCDHGVTFDQAEADILTAEKLLANWNPQNPEQLIAGNPASVEIRKRWPRLSGLCPKGCGYNGIAYASYEHYIMGDW